MLKDTFLILSVLVALILALKKLLEFSKRDVHELALQNQSSIGSTRRVAESAVYRSVDVPHGLPLTTGLEIRYDIYKSRNGNLKDIWSIAMDRSEEKVVAFDRGTKLSFSQLNGLMNQVHGFLDSNAVPENGSIGVCGPLSQLEPFLVACTCFFTASYTLHFFSGELPTDVNVSVLFVPDKFVDSCKGKAPLLMGWDDFKEVLQFHGKGSTEYGYTFSSLHDKTVPYQGFKHQKAVTFYQHNFVSAVAATLKSLPLELGWTASDHVLISSMEEKEFWVKFLAALVAESKHISISDEVSLHLVERVEPTILCVTAPQLKSLEQQLRSKGVSLLGRARLAQARNWFSKGVFTHLGEYSPLIRPLRILYVASSEKEEGPTSEEINYLQAILGARIIQERYADGILGPLLRTNCFDYRVMNKTTAVAQRGVPANCIEAKVTDTPLRKAENRQGKLFVRGFNIGRDLNGESNSSNEGWFPTEIEGMFGNDGCFYEFI